jgi:hypothetical protein
MSRLKSEVPNDELQKIDDFAETLRHDLDGLANIYKSR